RPCTLTACVKWTACRCGMECVAMANLRARWTRAARIVHFRLRALAAPTARPPSARRASALEYSTNRSPGLSTEAPPDALAALRNPYVRALALGRMAASMGIQFISVAVGWELYERTGDPWALGLVGLFEVAPVFLLMVPAGAVADRFPRRSVAMGAYGLFALA